MASMQDFIAFFSEKIGNTKVYAETVTKQLFESLKEYLEKEEEVKITDFGTFKIKETPARNGVNPATGEKIQIPAKKKVVFKPAKCFKEEIN